MLAYHFPPQDQFRLVQLTDCHLLAEPDALYQGVSPYRQLQAVVQQLAGHWPDAILLTGDLSQDHSEASYQHLQELMQVVPVPVFWLPGNHDDSQQLGELLTEAPFLPHKALHAASWHLLLLDSSGPTPAGYFPAERRMELAAQLKQHSQPCWLFAHHHPWPIGSSIDRHGWQDAEPFWQLLQQYPQVRGLAHGHCHHAYRRCQHGIELVGCPATSVQFQQTVEWHTDAQGPQWCEWSFQRNGSIELDFKRIMP